MNALFVASQYDYGDPQRGLSFEYENFLPVLESKFDVVDKFDFLSIFKQYGKEKMNQLLKDYVIELKPCIVFVVMTGEEFDKNVLKFIKNETDAILINWFCDDQWRFENFSKYYADCFNYVITTDKLSLSKYKKIGINSAILSQWASSDVQDINLDDVKYTYDVTFIGLKNDYRNWIVKSLKKNGIDVQCFGYGWENGKISKEKVQETMLQSKINLNLSNSFSYDLRYLTSSWKSFLKLPKNILFNNVKNVEQLKARHFEIPGAGGFQLTHYAPFLEEYYKIGEEIQIFTDLNDLCNKINYYLENEMERIQITKNGYKATRENHIYRNRFDDILNQIF